MDFFFLPERSVDIERTSTGFLAVLVKKKKKKGFRKTIIMLNIIIFSEK